jgi:predicted DNA-binding protein (MmcQ/YjbR family)
MRLMQLSAVAALLLVSACTKLVEEPRPPIPDSLVHDFNEWPFGQSASRFEGDNTEAVKFAFRNQYPQIRLNQSDAVSAENASKIQAFLTRYFAKKQWRSLTLPGAMAKTNFMGWEDGKHMFAMQSTIPDASTGHVMVLYYSSGFSSVRTYESDNTQP